MDQSLKLLLLEVILHFKLSKYGHVCIAFDVSLLGADEMAYLPFVPQVDGNSISSGDDTTTTVNIGVSFPFGSTSFSTLYVSIIIISLP